MMNIMVTKCVIVPSKNFKKGMIILRKVNFTLEEIYVMVSMDMSEMTDHAKPTE